VALAGGFFLSLRAERRQASRRPSETIESPSALRSDLSSADSYSVPQVATVRVPSLGSDGRASAWARERRIFYASTSLFLVFLSLAVLDLARSLYVASVLFYALVGCAAGALALNILVNGEVRPGSLLTQVMVLAILLRFHFVSLNPYLYTSDNYIFYLGLLDLKATGGIHEILGHYFFFPGFATYSYSGLSVAGLPVELFALFGFVAQLAMLPVVYLIGRHVASRTTGLFASMFVLFSIYAFLYTHASPTHYGLAFLFLAVYSAIRIGGDRGAVWLALFWLSAIAAMLSHPVNALVLGLVLTVRVIGVRTAERGAKVGTPSLTPVLAYAIVYGSYLAFLAATAFDLFVTTLFGSDRPPPLATIPGSVLQRSIPFILQSGLAPLGIVFPIFFAAYAVLRGQKMSKSEHGFFVTLGVAFLAIPGLEILGENFRLQSSRMLVYFVIPFAFLGAYGLATLATGAARRRRACVLVLGVFIACGFLASSSYLTQNDLRALNTDIPFSSTHITESALASRVFSGLTPNDSTIYFDYGSSRYFENSNRAREALFGRFTEDLLFYQESGSSGFVVINQDLLPYGVPPGGVFYDPLRIAERLQDQGASRLFDSGKVQVYFSP